MAEITKVPMMDTGIGQEMGYANDAEFIKAAQAERERILRVLTPEARKRVEDAELAMERQFIRGRGGSG